jgi:hypothetical protein
LRAIWVTKNEAIFRHRFLPAAANGRSHQRHHSSFSPAGVMRHFGEASVHEERQDSSLMAVRSSGGQTPQRTTRR